MRSSPKWLKTQLIKGNGKTVRVEPSNGKYFSLEELQGFVGGNMEILQVPRKPNMLMIVNEMGKLLDLPFNVTATALEFPLHDLIVGDVLLCRKEQIK